MHLRINPKALSVKLTFRLEDQILSKHFLAEQILNTLYHISKEKLDASLEVKIHTSILPLGLVNQSTHFITPCVTRLVPDSQRPERVARE